MSNWKQTQWVDETGQVTTIQDVLAILKDDPVVSLELKALDHIPSVLIQEKKLENADLSFPIIVVEKSGVFQMILDGHHRRHKAIMEKRTHILAKILKKGIFNTHH